MWVYQQQSVQTPAAPLLPAAAQESLEHTQEPGAFVRASAPPVRTGPMNRPRRTAGQATRDCILLAAAYLLGTLAAGVLQALCDAAEQETLQYFLQCWCGMFLLDGTRGAAALFGTEYLAGAGVATALLLLGFSAFGPVPIFFFMMLYGTGIGLLATQLAEGITRRTFAAYVLVAGLPAALAAACICMFGASALQVCSRLQRFSFARQGGAVGTGAGAQGLLGQYVLVMVLFVPLSGAAAGLVVLANQLHLW